MKVFTILILACTALSPLWSESPESEYKAPPLPVFTLPDELQKSLGESGVSPEVRPWAAGVAGTASVVLLFFSYRSLASGLEAAQEFRAPGEIHGHLFTGAALGFFASCLGVVIRDLLWPPDPPVIISEE